MTTTKQPNIPAWLVAILIALGAIGGGKTWVTSFYGITV